MDVAVYLIDILYVLFTIHFNPLYNPSFQAKV